MSILVKPYELSVWQDVYQSETNNFVEERICIIGTDSMESQNKAHNLKLTRSTKGATSLSFSMYSKYISNINGETVYNPFCQYLKNEAKLKLKHGNKWYDFIIKGCVEKTQNNTYEYTATDAHINELSKNGFNLELDSSLYNNEGTIEELGARILADTDWEIDTSSHKSVQTVEEPLVKLTVLSPFKAIWIKDPNNEQRGVSLDAIEKDFSAGTEIYAFYSSCKNQPRRFQFIYVDGNNYTTNDDRIITNSNCQYFVEYNVDLATIYTNKLDNHGFTIPKDLKYNNEDEDFIPVTLRGARYVFGIKGHYNKLLQASVTLCKDSTDDEYYYCQDQTTYINPTIIQNLSGNTQFKTTAGWTAQVLKHTGVITKHPTGGYYQFKGKVSPGASGDIVSKLLDDDSQASDFLEVSPYLKYTGSGEQSAEIANRYCTEVIVSSGFYDNRKQVGKLTNGEEYMIMFKYDLENDVDKVPNLIEIADYVYNSAGCYQDRPLNKENFSTADDAIKPYLSFSTTGDTSYAFVTNYQDKFVGAYNIDSKQNDDYSVYNNYVFSVAKVANANLSEEEVMSKKIQMFIYRNGTNTNLNIADIQLFKVAKNEEGKYITPFSGLDASIIQHKYLYYKKNTLEAATSLDQIKPDFTYSDSEPLTEENKLRFIPQYYDTAEKVRSIKVKESNYFNALQSLSETFQSWVDFKIERNDSGAIISKKIRFANYIGVENYAGFKYGINLQNISRSIDSKAIVTKMIVKDNNNTSAKNGFCSITRAGGNETGENYLLDFTYYINKGLIDGKKLSALLYDTEGAVGEDIKPLASGEETNCNGYYTRLRALNTKIDQLNEKNHKHVNALNDAQAKLAVAEAGLTSAREDAATAMQSFEAIAGFSLIPPSDIGYSPEQKKTIKTSSELTSYLVKYTENVQAEDKFEKQVAQYQSTLEKLKIIDSNQKTEIDNLIRQKKQLNLAFFKLYGRYLQEGTWIDEKYIDDEQYFIDAQSTMYNSCFPKITYTINVVDLSRLPGYEHYTFDLGDKTFIEDVEFFGYNSMGYPYREEIVLTEITEMLDNPNKNTIKVQNYKTQFQDLFQSITATVQQTKFSEGSYKKAADLAKGTSMVKSKFLMEALEDANVILRNAGEQSVTWDGDGLVVTDITEPSEQIRLIGGAILIKTKGEDGIGTWKTAITSKGITADLITAGRVNTGEIQIMNGDQPTFRWDSYGITAYDYNMSGNSILNINFGQGVRFDKHGLYGYKTKDGYNFNSTDLSTAALMNNTDITFALTWEGLRTSKWIEANTTENISDRYLGATGVTSTDSTFKSYGRVRLYAGANINDNGIDYNSSRFCVTDRGYMRATYGEIGPFNLNSAGIWNDNHNIELWSNGSIKGESLDIEGNIYASSGIEGFNINLLSTSYIGGRRILTEEDLNGGGLNFDYSTNDSYVDLAEVLFPLYDKDISPTDHNLCGNKYSENWGSCTSFRVGKNGTQYCVNFSKPDQSISININSIKCEVNNGRQIMIFYTSDPGRPSPFMSHVQFPGHWFYLASDNNANRPYIVELSSGIK